MTTGSFDSPMRRLTSPSARAGTMTVTASPASSRSGALSTDKRKPSAAASTIVDSLISVLTPVSTGRESSVAAAKNDAADRLAQSFWI